MKNIFTTVLCFLLIGSAYGQNILLVDNTPTAPTGDHVYVDITTALAAAQPGDIIHVKPSSVSYGNVTITTTTDSISIFSVGFNPDKEIQQTTTLGTVYITGQNIKISGFIITGSVYIGYSGTAGNLSFENSQFDGAVHPGWGYTVNNVLFRNCLFRSSFQCYAGRVNSVVANNCIFSYNSTTTAGQIYLYDGTLMNNCLVFGDGAASRFAFHQLHNSTVSNTIFYGRSPAVNGGNYSNSTFNNCYAEQTFDDNIPSANGNSVNNTVPSISGTVFTDTNIGLSLVWNKNWLPDLDPVSTELIDTGDNGTNIGPTGGTIPFNVYGTPLPYIQKMVVPAVIRKGDNLDVSIEATGGN